MPPEFTREPTLKARLNQRECTPDGLTELITLAGFLCGCYVFQDLSQITRDWFAAIYEMRSGNPVLVPCICQAEVSAYNLAGDVPDFGRSVGSEPVRSIIRRC